MDSTKQLPLHDRHAAAGARFSPFAGYNMPARFTTIKDEHVCVRERAGLFDVSHMGEVFVRGPGAIAAVNRVVANNVETLYDGKALYSVMCRPDGGIIDDLIVYRLDAETVLLCVNASNRAKDYAWIAEQIGDAAEVTDESDDYAQLALQGPLAEEILQGLTSTALPEIAFYHAAWGEVAGERVLISRTGYTGEDGFELYIPVGSAVAVYDAVVAAGAPRGMQSIGLGARDTLRLEAKYHLYGNDMDETVNPVEAGLMWTVKLNAGDFVGRDAIAAAKAAGPSRRLRGLVLQGRGVIRHGYALYVGDTRVGEVTSGSVAPSLGGKSIGMGYIDVAHCNDDVVEVEIRGKRVPATVTRKPFYKR